MWSTSVPSKPSEQAKSTSLSKCPVFPTSVLYFDFFRVVQSDDTRWENKDVDLRHDGLDLDTFKARLQGAEGVTFGKQNTTTRTTESGSAIFAVSVQKGSLSVNDTRAP